MHAGVPGTEPALKIRQRSAPRVAIAVEQIRMSDVVLVITVIAFFALCWAYVRGCDRM